MVHSIADCFFPATGYAVRPRQGKSCFMKTKTSGSPTLSEHGFTRVELTAVIIAVAFLGALVLPALAKGHAGSRTVVCLNNHRQLARSCLLYSQDANSRLPNNYTLPGDGDRDLHWGFRQLGQQHHDVERQRKSG